VQEQLQLLVLLQADLQQLTLIIWFLLVGRRVVLTLAEEAEPAG
jgi:hypothetical protein